MRPYLGILKDSFREALASRVLWILLVLATLFLCLIAPFGLSEQKAKQFARNSVTRWGDLAAKLVEQGTAETPSPAKQLWKRLPDDVQGALKEAVAEPGGEFPFRVAARVLDEFNQAITDRGLYSAADWEGVTLSDEAQKLRAQGVDKLSTDDLARFNRLLIEGVFPEEIPRNNSTDTNVTYLWWTLGGGLPLTRAQLTPILRLFVTGIVNVVVGALGGFAAILVTASMITQTFEAGSIDLLLSKPVSRSLVFLTKFLGGCVFIGLNALYFIAGMWLVMGLRFDLWISKLWWCIPVFLFMYIVFYSVCALAGVVWRNTIVAIVLTIAFWGVGYVVLIVKSTMEVWAMNPKRMIQLTAVGESRIGVTERGQAREWNATEQRWDDVFTVPGEQRRVPPVAPAPQMIGPVYDSTHRRLYAIQMPPQQGRRGFQLFPPTISLHYAEPGDGWMRKDGPPTPAGTRALFIDQNQRLLAVATDGVFRLEEPADKPLSKKSGKFLFLGPQPRLKLGNDSTASFDPASGCVATFAGGELTLLEPNSEGKYSQRAQTKIDDKKKARKGMCLAVEGGVIVALEDGRILVRESTDLSPRHEFHPNWWDAPHLMSVSPDGHWGAIVFHGGDLWMYDARQKREVPLPVSGQGSVSAVAFDGPNHILVVDRETRVTRYQLDPFKKESAAAAPLELVDMAYHYGVQPLYAVVRKPVELNNVTTWLLTESDQNSDDDAESEEIEESRTKLDAWGTLKHSSAFVIIVLGVTCWYISRKDF